MRFGPRATLFFRLPKIRQHETLLRYFTLQERTPIDARYNASVDAKATPAD